MVVFSSGTIALAPAVFMHSRNPERRESVKGARARSTAQDVVRCPGLHAAEHIHLAPFLETGRERQESARHSNRNHKLGHLAGLRLPDSFLICVELAWWLP